MHLPLRRKSFPRLRAKEIFLVSSSFYDYNLLCVYAVAGFAFYADQPLFYPLLFAKFGRFTPNRLALIGQKVALIGHFHFFRLALIGHGHFRKSLIMNKSSWKYGSFPKICKQSTISLTLVFWILIFNFPPCRFQCKAINETAAVKPTFFSSYPHSPTTNRIVARTASKYT